MEVGPLEIRELVVSARVADKIAARKPPLSINHAYSVLLNEPHFFAETRLGRAASYRMLGQALDGKFYIVAIVETKERVFGQSRRFIASVKSEQGNCWRKD